MNVIFQCNCFANCGTVVYEENNRIYFKSAVVTTPEIVQSVDDKGFVNGKWSLNTQGERKVRQAIRIKELGF